MRPSWALISDVLGCTQATFEAFDQWGVERGKVLASK
jgi:glucose-6-phosphate isomerase